MKIYDFDAMKLPFCTIVTKTNDVVTDCVSNELQSGCSMYPSVCEIQKSKNYNYYSEIFSGVINSEFSKIFQSWQVVTTDSKFQNRVRTPKPECTFLPK